MTIESINIIIALKQSHLYSGRPNERGGKDSSRVGLCSRDHGSHEGTNERSAQGMAGVRAGWPRSFHEGHSQETQKPVKEQDKEEGAMQDKQASPSAFWLLD